MRNFYDNKKINEIANEIVKHAPSMSDYLGSDESLSNYSKRINKYLPDKTHLDRQSYFKKELKKKIKRIFNKEEINLEIKNDWGVIGGIVEHHGILDHPLLLSVILVSNFHKIIEGKEDILIFATGNIPLNEPFRKRGFTFKGQKFNLYPKSYKNKVVYGLDKYDFDIKQKIIDSHKWHLLSEQEQEFFEEINEIIKKINFSTCETMGDQLSKINFHLWPLLFKKKPVNLISIEYDDIIISSLIKLISEDTENHVYKMLFDKEFRNIILKEFEGEVGAWNEEKNIGTHFFWGLNKKNERVRLTLRGDNLVGEDMEIPLNLKSIIKELKNKRILPGMLLKFSFIVFYMGMKPLMGYSLEYMVRLKAKMIEILEKHFPEECERSQGISYDNMNLISICKENLYAFDIFYQKGFPENYFEKLDTIPFKNFIIPDLLFAYNYFISKFGDPKSKINFKITKKDLQKYVF